MNNKVKAAIASYARSFLAAALAVYGTGNMNWKAMLGAGLAATVPVALRVINKKDPAFGLFADLAEIEIKKLK